MSDWEPVIGLEIHVQLGTRTKMFCGCELTFGDPPNTHTCPICLGLPGTLPVVNAQAIHDGLLMGLAFGCEIAPRSIFHRKNYFYPDLAKGYQISQYDIPLCGGGRLGDVRFHRIHLEEDAAKMIHVGTSGRIHGSDASVVDYNRGGTPLAEMVTEPDIHSPEQAREWLTLLRETLRQLGVSDVDMSQGSLRCDANVSVRPTGSTGLGTKTELKNMNSFAFLEAGIRAEVARQIALLEAGEAVVQETLHFDPRTGSISSLRSKEEAHDYRYFPEPDLVAVAPTEAMLQAARDALPELPADRIVRYTRDFGLSDEQARTLTWRLERARFFEETVEAGSEPVASANWLARAPETGELTPGALAALVALVADRTISSDAGRRVLEILVAEGGEPQAVVEREGLAAMGADGELSAIVDRVIASNPDIVERAKANPKAANALMGPIMRETKGRADGAEVQRMIAAKLGL